MGVTGLKVARDANEYMLFDGGHTDSYEQCHLNPCSLIIKWDYTTQYIGDRTNPIEESLETN